MRPYLLVRAMPGVYLKRFLSLGEETSSVFDSPVTLGCPRSPGATWADVLGTVAHALKELSASSGLSLCLVLGPQAAIYVYPSGTIQRSASVPRLARGAGGSPSVVL